MEYTAGMKILLDSKLVIQDASQKLAMLFECNINDLIGKPFIKLIHKKVPDPIKVQFIYDVIQKEPVSVSWNLINALLGKVSRQKPTLKIKALRLSYMK